MFKLTLRFLLLAVLVGSTPGLTKAQMVAAPKYLTTDFGQDAKAPGSCEELTIPSHGSRLAAFMYTAPGPQPHPTLILLHGFPGNERNLDIAQSVRRAGWNVLYFNYRGSWGSEGDFSFANCVEDVASAVAFCKQQAQTLHIDTARLALFGHSMGGWTVLAAAAAMPAAYSSMVLEGSSTGAPFAQDGSTIWPRNLAIVFSRYDEFSKLMWGVARAQDVSTSSKLQSVFGTNAPVAEGRLYGAIAKGTARKLYQPSTTHPGDHVSTVAIGLATEWFAATLIGGTARPACCAAT